MINIVSRRKIWFAISVFLVSGSLIAVAMWGLKFGIEFTGGSLLEVGVKNGGVLSVEDTRESLRGEGVEDSVVQLTGDDTVLIRIGHIDEAKHQQILLSLNEKAGAHIVKTENDSDKNVQKAEVKLETTGGVEGVEVVQVDDEDEGAEVAKATSLGGLMESEQYIIEKQFDSIGPVIGEELRSSTLWALIITLLAISAYIAWAFRKISYPVSSTKYGLAAIISLLHDLIITIGVFSVLGNFYGVEVGVAFVAALLAILGYSINDTIVVFDRTRENLIKSRSENFAEVVNRSVNETLTRSINTSFTTLLTLIALWFFGGSSISYFVLALIVGISAGTYSSIFIASPLLVSWYEANLEKRA